MSGVLLFVLILATPALTALAAIAHYESNQHPLVQTVPKHLDRDGTLQRRGR